MFNVATIGTKNYFPLTKRLFASLQNSGNDFHLTVFCDDAESFRALERSRRCTVRELPEINSIGIKRARFLAYTLALQNGGFLYLDSDVIVLKPIEELAAHARITGCYDDLSSVHIIPDKLHPWAGDLSLENRWFINSGVFYAPRSRRGFFEELLVRSRKDELWERYGVLYDNSFLCAHFNLLNEMVDYVDSTVYNWQGFVVDGQLQVQRSGDSLVNCHSGKVLKIAHFAGVPNPDAAMCRWPVAVTSLLASRGSMNEISREHALVEFLGTLNPDFDYPPRDPTPRIVLDAMLRETVDLTSTQLLRDYSELGGYFADRETILSLAHSEPPSRYLWNGLACGGSCLDGEEYNFLLSAIRDLGIRTAIHTGTAETGRLFQDFEVEAWRVESTDGVGADDHGRRAAVVKADPESDEGDRLALRQSTELLGVQQFDLLLIQVRPGTRARGIEIERLIELAQPKYLAVHDAHRNSQSIFALQQKNGLRLIDHLASARGFVLLAVPSAVDPSKGAASLPPFDFEVELAHPRIRIQLAKERIVLLPDDLRRISVTVTNLGDEALSSRYSRPVLLSYHWMSGDLQVKLRDGLRSALPFDVLPGCSATIEMTVAPPPDSECSLVCLTLVHEGVCWFDDVDPGNRLLVQCDGEKAYAQP
jgi:hypothetical protein